MLSSKSGGDLSFVSTVFSYVFSIAMALYLGYIL
jgi:hypothetical protein